MWKKGRNLSGIGFIVIENHQRNKWLRSTDQETQISQLHLLLVYAPEGLTKITEKLYPSVSSSVKWTCMYNCVLNE